MQVWTFSLEMQSSAQCILLHRLMRIFIDEVWNPVVNAAHQSKVLCAVVGDLLSCCASLFIRSSTTALKM